MSQNEVNAQRNSPVNKIKLKPSYIIKAPYFSYSHLMTYYLNYVLLRRKVIGSYGGEYEDGCLTGCCGA
jgi:hypothetical protein